MPIYEYICQQCGLHFEKRQNVSDAPLTTCEKCHGKLEKQWSLAGFQFKGAGWYVTDYSSKKTPPGESTAKGDSASKSPEAASTSSVDKTSKTPSE